MARFPEPGAIHRLQASIRRRSDDLELGRSYVATMIRWMEDVETSGPLIVVRGVLALVVLVLIVALNTDAFDVGRQIVFALIKTSVGF